MRSIRRRWVYLAGSAARRNRLSTVTSSLGISREIRIVGFFWGRAGLRSGDLMRVIPKLLNRFRNPSSIILKLCTQVPVPINRQSHSWLRSLLLKIVAATNGEKADDMPILQEAPASFCSNLEKN